MQALNDLAPTLPLPQTALRAATHTSHPICRTLPSQIQALFGSGSRFPLSVSNATLLNENKILKRAVTRDHTARAPVPVEPIGGGGQEDSKVGADKYDSAVTLQSVGSLRNDFVMFGPGDWREGGTCSEF